MIALMLQFAWMVWIEYPWIERTGIGPLEYLRQHAKQSIRNKRNILECMNSVVM